MPVRQEKSTEAQTRRSPRGRAHRHAFPVESWTLSFPRIDCASTHGVLPTRAASPSISVQSLYSGSITQEWSTAHMANLSLQPLQGLNCVIQAPIITLLVFLEWSASTLNTIWQGPHPRYCVVRPAITQITLLGYLSWPEVPRQTGTPLPSITLQSFRFYLPRANLDPSLDKFKVFSIQFENFLMTRKQKIPRTCLLELNLATLVLKVVFQDHLHQSHLAFAKYRLPGGTSGKLRIQLPTQRT